MPLFCKCFFLAVRKSRLSQFVGTNEAPLKSIFQISCSCPHLFLWNPSPRYFERLAKVASRGSWSRHSHHRDLLPFPLWPWPPAPDTVLHSTRDSSGAQCENTSVCVTVSSPGSGLNAEVGRIVPSPTLHLIHHQGPKAVLCMHNVLQIPSWKQFHQHLPQTFLQRGLKIVLGIGYIFSLSLPLSVSLSLSHTHTHNNHTHKCPLSLPTRADKHPNPWVLQGSRPQIPVRTKLGHPDI